MRHFANDEVVARLEASLASGRPASALAELAWHLRQRDSARAAELAREALALAPGAPDEGQRARAVLALAESSLHLARVDEAASLCEEAGAAFRAAGDALGRGDCALVRARIAEVRGMRDRELAAHGAAITAFAAAGDAEREAHARLWALLASGFGDPHATAATLDEIGAAAVATHSAALRVHLRFVQGVAAFQRNAFLEAVPAFEAVAAEGPGAGLLEQAFRAESGLVSAHSNLGDRESARQAAELGLARARALGWPRAIGHALANFARQLSDGGEHEAAVGHLLEARSILADQPRARGYAIATYYLGDACLALGRNEEALGHLRRAEGIMRDLGSRPEIACLQAIGAQALSRLGRTEEATRCAGAALDLARQTGARLWEVEALRSLAEIHAARGAPAGESLACLEQALAVVESIGGHHEKAQLYGEIARAHERAGDLRSALAAERAAHAEDVKEGDRRTLNRLLLARERHEAEKALERARSLEASLETLEQLRQVGQDITAHLDAAGMLRAIDRHLARLADVTFLAVLVFDAAGACLRRSGIERGRELPDRDIALADLDSYAAQAARERREIHVDAPEGGRPASRIPGTQVTRSLWFGPLCAGEELLGVLTVQTDTPRAYGEREKLVFRTVSGYAAVALANARTHGELETKHRHLIGTEARMRLLATTDPLSGLANRRRFLEAAESEVARAARYGGAIGLVMADLDRFKAVNDSLGHGAGDHLIAAIAGVLRAQQRPHDVTGRLGGDEFAIVLPGADLEATAAAAERLRAAVASLRVDWHGEALTATLSMGCASASGRREGAADPADELGRLMRAADAALYEAKRGGRNLVCRAAAPQPG